MTRVLMAVAAVTLVAADRPNVLFVVADDLRPELGCYGSPAVTPNIDALARTGVRFDRAYCQQAVCNPSRSSFLTGRRPDTLGLYVNGTHFRQLRPDVETLPGWFKRHGYHTRGVGKVFHNWHTAERGDRRAWSADEFLHYANHGADTPQVAGEPPPNRGTVARPRTDRRDVPDEAYYDGRVAAEAVRLLAEVKDQPFFLAVGFWKPHAPFNAPAKYWDRYDPAKLPILDPRRPADAPAVAFHDNQEFRGGPDKPPLALTPAEAAELRHGYLAGVSYMDAQLGKVLAALDRHGLRGNTVVVFVGDHGYHLGEKGLWAKTSCFERDARVPLLIVPPGGKPAVAVGIAELVDLFPTLVDLCGLPTPAGLDGVSLAPVLADATRPGKPAAFTQHPRPAYPDRTPAGVPEAMGCSVRTPAVRYTEWREWRSGKLVATELYDHAGDPDESRNVAAAPPDPAARDAARRLLHEQFPPATPPADRGSRR